MPQPLDRRHFLGTVAAAGVAAQATAAPADEASVEPVRVGVMGLKRGCSLARVFSLQPGVEVAYVCDVDTNRAEKCAKSMEEATGKAPAAVGDFRRILDDKSVDVLICAAPNHWHGPATILACQAGKHVYVEKPCSHNAREGELMIEAARKYDRAVQVGTQRRSSPVWQEAIKSLEDGVIGRVYLARTWYDEARNSIGTAADSEAPPHIDYDLWQGPAPRRPYRSNVVHYNWHWWWHWGNGELGNNGVHAIDLARWGLGTDFPVRVTSSGGRYHFDDDQQTPDTLTVCIDFEGRRQLTWQGLSCNRLGKKFVSFYGTDGTMEVQMSGARVVYDRYGTRVAEHGGTGIEMENHVANFLAAIRNDRPLELAAEIAEGHKSTLLCHLGNMAHRVGRSLDCNPANGHILDDPEAMKLWSREYEPGWEPKV